MRSQSATDYGVAYDIFLRDCYKAPEPLGEIRNIVDLGANVGYSCLFWCHDHPKAHVTAFEPHPAHVYAINKHLSANNFSDRVEVVKAAVGVSEGEAYLVDAGSSSVLTSSPTGYAVPIVDIFNTVKSPIDLIKIDIEGGEYGLLGDDRFNSLGARNVVVEWHKRDDQPDGKEWCQNRLHSLGYRTSIGCEDLPLAGLIWGFKGN